MVVQGSKPIPCPLVILNQMSHFGGMLIEYDFLKLGIYSFSQIDENLTYISSSQTPRIVGSSKGKKPN